VWKYNRQELFRINGDGTGTISGETGYSVQTRKINDPLINGEVIFKKGSTVTGQFIYSLNGGGAMWIPEGTGPFAKWVNLGTNGQGGNWWIVKD
jgi:hypothetical protein